MMDRDRKGKCWCNVWANSAALEHSDICICFAACTNTIGCVTTHMPMILPKEGTIKNMVIIYTDFCPTSQSIATKINAVLDTQVIDCDTILINHSLFKKQKFFLLKVCVGTHASKGCFLRSLWQQLVVLALA